MLIVKKLWNWYCIDRSTKELLKLEYSHELCLIHVALFQRGVALKLTMPILSCLYTQHLKYPYNTKFSVKIKKLVRNF